MLPLAELNGLPATEAAAHLHACCGSAVWVAKMVNARPFESIAALLRAADLAWAATGPVDWIQAFAAHPRIGERAKSVWSKDEQSTAARSSEAVQMQTAQLNAEYERRFGHIYIVCATGRSGEEILADLTARLDNNPEDELRVAATEQHRITRLRLGKLIGVEEG